jgi:protein gp37
VGKDTRISWAHATFNGWIGCVEVSPACDNCYARTLSERWGYAVWGKDTPRRRTSVSYWRQPVKWNRDAAKSGQRRRVFAFSLSDVFEDRRDLDAWRADLWRLIEETPNLDWMLLTKRHDSIARMLPEAWLAKPRSNVWLGVTAENQRRAEERIPALLEVPAAVHWISAEPLLGPIDVSPWMAGASHGVTDDLYDAPDGAVVGGEERIGDTWRRRNGVDWVIVGGESGADARRMDPAWARDILDQCRRGGAAFHFKQKGGILAKELGCKDREGKDSTEWPLEFRVQEFPAVA